MPISRIRTNAVDLDNLEIGGTEASRMPVGTTAQRASAKSGDIRFNDTLDLMEYYTGTVWKSIDTPPSITAVTYPNSQTSGDTAGGETITLTGDNFATTGTVSVEVGGSSASSVTVNSAQQLTFTSPSGSAGDATVEVINPSGLSGRATFSYSGTPVWNTAADTILGDFNHLDTVNITSLSATDDGSSTGVTYSVTTGSLPTGLSLNANTCAITGTIDNSSATGFTTYTFSLTATDNDGQTTARQFKITGSPNYFGDGSDGDLNT